MEAQAKHDFEPKKKDTDELAFQRGDKMLILNYGDPVSWYQAEIGGQTGSVPGNYIAIDVPKWYMGRISRSTAEQMLQGNKFEGAFLVRLSESSPTDFSLSVKCGQSVQHFKILKDNSDGGYYLWSTRFDSLNKLVDHYRNETVSRTHQIFLTDMDRDGQFVVQALYDFDSKESAELQFKKGDLITVSETSDDNWWGGCIGDMAGFFPKLYVREFNPL